MTPVLSVENLSIAFTQEGRSLTVVNGVSYHINPGEVVALVGESGSGKSVTALSSMKLLGRSAQISGTTHYNGQDISDHDEGALLAVVDLVDLHDVWVGELGHGLGLADEPCAHVLIAQGVEALDGDLAIEGPIVGRVDHPHPARAERPDDPEATDLHAGGELAGDRLGRREAVAG